MAIEKSNEKRSTNTPVSAKKPTPHGDGSKKNSSVVKPNFFKTIMFQILAINVALIIIFVVVMLKVMNIFVSTNNSSMSYLQNIASIASAENEFRESQFIIANHVLNMSVSNFGGGGMGPDEQRGRESIDTTTTDTTSADTTDTKQYVISVPKAKYTIAELTGLSIVGNGSVYDLYNAGNTATTSFVSGTTNYTLRVSKDNSTLTFTPTVDTTKFETIKIGGSTVTSGSSSNVSVSTSTSSVAILVTAQDGTTTNIYTISLYWLKDDTSLASVSITVDSHITNNATYNSSTSTYSLSGSTAVPFGSSIFTFAPPEPKCKGDKVLISTANSAIFQPPQNCKSPSFQ